MSKLVELYNTHPYEPLVPAESKKEQMVYKFNSPQHFISFIENLDANFKSASSQVSSKTGSTSFTGSKDMKDAYELIRGTEFKAEDVSSLESKVSHLKKQTEFADEGDDLEVPEYLAGSDRVWLRGKNRTRPTRMIDDILIIDAVYTAARDAEISRQIGVAILQAIYRRKVVPRKMIIGFAANEVRYGKGGKELHLATVDVAFSDLNGIAKILHPSTFRRLWFRLAEQYPDLSGGYGSTLRRSTEKGYISIDRMHSVFDDKVAFDKEIAKFIGEVK